MDRSLNVGAKFPLPRGRDWELQEMEMRCVKGRRMGLEAWFVVRHGHLHHQICVHFKTNGYQRRGLKWRTFTAKESETVWIAARRVAEKFLIRRDGRIEKTSCGTETHLATKMPVWRRRPYLPHGLIPKLRR